MALPTPAQAPTVDPAGVEAVAALQRAALELVEVLEDSPARLPVVGGALLAEMARRLPAAQAAILATPGDWS